MIHDHLMNNLPVLLVAQVKAIVQLFYQQFQLCCFAFWHIIWGTVHRI